MGKRTRFWLTAVVLGIAAGWFVSVIAAAREDWSLYQCTVVGLLAGIFACLVSSELRS